MVVLSYDFSQKFKDYPLMSQKRESNPIALVKLVSREKVFYLLEYSVDACMAY